MDEQIQMLNSNVTKRRHASLQHAHSLRLCRDGLLSAPRSLMLDGIVSYGGGTGEGLNLVKKAFGEYYERNHFFTAVPVTKEMALKEVRPLDYQQQLASLCQYTDYEQLLAHRFSFTKVYHLFDDQPFSYLYNAVSLRTLPKDMPFLKVNDSCGCASHITKEKALYHSLIEFLERQALLGSWIAKSPPVYRIKPEVLCDLSPYRDLVSRFLDNGALYIYGIGNHLPGYNLIMFYFAHSATDAVQYCVGSKTSGSLKDALCSAFEELYQCYTFLYSAAFKENQLEDKAGTGYHMAFIQYNNQETRKRIPYFNLPCDEIISSTAELEQQPCFSFKQMLDALQTLASNLYYYHYYEEALGLHFSKIISPDFFAHMSLDKPLNLNCHYAKLLDIKPESAYLEMLPFP